MNVGESFAFYIFYEAYSFIYFLSYYMIYISIYFQLIEHVTVIMLIDANIQLAVLNVKSE